MKTTYFPRHALLRWLALVAPILLGGACVPVSPLGTVVVGPGEEIQIRSMEALTGIGELGIPRQRAAAMAIADYGPIKGHRVSMGGGLDTQCTAEGGAAAAATVVGDRRVVGVLGTSCSVAAVAAAPIVSEAGLAMISSSNTAPSLTSDLRGTAGADYHAGFYRVSSNDLHQAQAVADFAYSELGLRRMATMHDGDPYSSGLSGAFAAVFEALGGTVTAVAEVSKGETEMAPVLTDIAADGAEGIFFILFPEEAGHVVRQAGDVAGLEGAALITGVSLMFTELDAVDVYLSGLEFSFEGSVNEATGKSADEVYAAYKERYGDHANPAYVAQAYDATVVLLRAIEAASVAVGESLYIDRARLREALTNTVNFDGLIGTISCDGFGDCGTGRIHISHYTDPSVGDVAALPVVYRYEP